MNVEQIERQIEQARDQDRVITPDRSFIVLDKIGKRAIRVAGDADETETRGTFAALGWRWIDRVAGEVVD